MFPARKEAGISGLNQCPNCRGMLIGDQEKGEILCPHCGFVAVDQSIDTAPEWKQLDYEERSKRMRVGLPASFALHDYGLSTDISGDNRDSHGRYLDQTNRQSAQRMQKWQRRIRTSAQGERSLANALTKITEAADQLRLPAPIVEEASHIFRKSAKQSVSKSKSIAGMAAASIYLACRRSKVNRSLREISKAAGTQERSSARYFRLLLNEVEKNYVPPPTVQKYISKLVNKEKINPKVERIALDLADRATESEISSGKTPSGLAAAYVYIASVLCSEHIPQREIAEIAEVTEVTVRNRCREILEKFTIRQRLRVSLP
ncbi:MAG TPA: TFIIB-type zinc ribbon-containing protein [Nitrososphaerales archaeon]|nr:TFIIB-type zinc ribbon-containing protein [Nitrososphaerales archaeon]